jgi:hypothetical protein
LVEFGPLRKILRDGRMMAGKISKLLEEVHNKREEDCGWNNRVSTNTVQYLLA